MSSIVAILLALGLSGAPAPHDQRPTPDAAVQATVGSAGFKAAVSAMDRDFERHITETITLTEIPSPPFKETARAKVYLGMLKQLGLSDVEMDTEGNVMGIRHGVTNAAGGPLIAIAAHLDTVFPEGTDVKVTRTGTRLAAPGVGDDTRSLAVLLAFIRAMDAAKIQTKMDILFIGNVGEEGPGDLRGVRYLFNKSKYKDRIIAFISADGTKPGDRIVTGAVGSKRYHVTFKGPGGHSYNDFGLVNPAFAMAQAMKAFGALTVPSSPKTTFSVGLVGGGTSVNAIPTEMWMDIDMRSESRQELDAIDAAFKRIVASAVEAENAARSTAKGRITAEVTLTGDRPSGQTAATSAIAQTAAAAVRAFGLTPSFVFSSTDSNIPISRGIPAITVDAGGNSDRNHSPDEWIDLEKTSSLRGMQILLATLLTLAGMQ